MQINRSGGRGSRLCHDKTASGAEVGRSREAIAKGGECLTVVPT